MAETQVTGTTFNEHWIDGGTASVSPAFNIDNPVMWTPITVISGLASGYCERAAVISGGTLATSDSVVVEWDNATDAQKEATVSKCAANIALGVVPLVQMDLYRSADATFAYPTSGTSNYMKTMDALITQLVQPGGYVMATGFTYSENFSGVALAATARAAAATPASAITTPTSNGNTTVMTPAYPASWAIQRKWMLDELRYTGNTVTYTKVTGIYGNALECNAGGTATTVKADNIDSFTSMVINSADAMLGPLDLLGYGSAAINYVQGTRISTEAGATYRAQEPCYLPYGICITGVTAAVSSTVYASCYAAAPIAQAYGVNVVNNITELSTGVITITGPSNTVYIVPSGCTATFTGTAVGSVFIDIKSGGSALVADTVALEGANINAGGALLHTQPRVDGSSYYNPGTPGELLYNYRGQDSFYDSPYTYKTTGTITDTAQNNFVASGTVSASAASMGILGVEADTFTVTGGAEARVVLVSSGATLDVVDGVVEQLYINYGGSANIRCNLSGTITVFSGGTLSVASTGIVTNLNIEDGAVLYLSGTDINTLLPGEVSACLFNPLKATPTSPIQSGWCLLSGTVFASAAATGGTACVYGSAGSGVISTVRDELTSNVSLIDVTAAQYNTTAYGVSILGNTTYNGYSFIPLLSSASVTHGYHFLALYGVGAGGGVVNHYTDFRCRQSSTDFTTN